MATVAKLLTIRSAIFLRSQQSTIEWLFRGFKEQTKLTFTFYHAEGPLWSNRRPEEISLCDFVRKPMIYGLSRFEAEDALTRFHAAIIDLELTVNSTDTKALRFRKRGKTVTILYFVNSLLASVDRFPCLDVLSSANGRSSVAYVIERCGKAVWAV